MTQETNSDDLNHDVTETSTTQAKTYSQEEFDSHMSRMRKSLEAKYAKRFDELGDIDELLQLRQDSERVKQEQAIKRGEFEKILQDTVQKKDSEIAKRDTVIKEYKINTPLMSAAAKYKAINVDQVKSLLINNLRLNDEGEVEVVDEKGTVRYSDSGTQLSVDDLVKEFLGTNSHFVSPTPASSMTKSNVNASVKSVDITKLDMTKAEDRQIYKEYRKTNGIR